MNNRDKYRRAFSVLHASETTDWEEIMEQNMQRKHKKTVVKLLLLAAVISLMTITVSADSVRQLFGCGGNRSKLRRYEMGEVSGRLADLTIITSDNPRNEEPQAIIDDIKVGIAKTEGKYVEIPDRKEAIAYAIHHGEPGDIVILAGKGHEDYQ